MLLGILVPVNVIQEPSSKQIDTDRIPDTHTPAWMRLLRVASMAKPQHQLIFKLKQGTAVAMPLKRL